MNTTGIEVHNPLYQSLESTWFWQNALSSDIPNKQILG